MKRKSFFESRKGWSKRKHRLLGKYLPPFSAKVGSWAPLIYCVDGFAGKAQYEDGEAGSPLLIAQLADKCASWQKPVNLQVINVESDSTNFASLREATRQWEKRDVVTNLQGEFGNLVPLILSIIGNAPALFFLDPFGPTGVYFDNLRPILERSQHATELIINFDADGLRRIGDTIHSRVQTESVAKGAQTNISNVGSIVGSSNWKAQFETGNLSAKEREQVLLGEYMSNLSKYQYSVASYAIRESATKSTKYHLIFCSRHPDGVILMNSFIRDEEDELIRDSTTKPNQPKLPLEEFDAVQQEIQRRRTELHTLVINYLQVRRKTTRGQIRRYFIFQRFGEFHDKDYNFVVQELINNGNIQTGHGRKRINDDEPLTYVQ